MLVGHALWSPGAGFCFWAEDASLVTALVMQPPGRGQPVLPPIVAHPFTVAPEVVAGILTPAGTAGAEEGAGGLLTLMLPTNSWGPIPSPRARVAGVGRPPTRVEHLRPWLVPVVCLAAQVAVDLLLDRPGPAGTEEQPVIIGGAWDWLAAVAETAVELVAAGRALPGIVEPAGGRTQARWLPVPTAADGREADVGSALAVDGGLDPCPSPPRSRSAIRSMTSALGRELRHVLGLRDPVSARAARTDPGLARQQAAAMLRRLLTAVEEGDIDAPGSPGARLLRRMEGAAFRAEHHPGDAQNLPFGERTGKLGLLGGEVDGRDQVGNGPADLGQFLVPAGHELPDGRVALDVAGVASGDVAGPVPRIAPFRDGGVDLKRLTAQLEEAHRQAVAAVPAGEVVELRPDRHGSAGAR